ncbi:MAG: GntR family transcriptional regulator [Gammaproteobacteria bacterium]|nr:GntR family transcriptional regulator [Gammaproteobacteria bacterium]
MMEFFCAIGLLMIERVNALKYGLCGLLCVLSMVLTACFSLSFGSGMDGNNQWIVYGSLALLVLIGLVLDLSKYVFWSALVIDNNRIYRALAVVLMLFSWLASVAFFISSENHKMLQARINSAEYTAYIQRLSSLDRKIEDKQREFNQRINSKFHDQWDKSTALLEEIEVFSSSKVSLLLKEPDIGRISAAQSVVSMAFFNSIAHLLKLNSDSVRNGFYALLALLIEVCAFGLLSLCRKDPVAVSILCSACSIKVVIETPLGRNGEPPALSGEDTDGQEKLIADIRSGKVIPVFNQLKGHYGLSHVKIREVLKQLKADGVLVEGSRRSLELAG